MKKIRFSLLAILGIISCPGCEEALETVLTEKNVVLQAPANKIKTSDPNQTFYWDFMDGASEFQLQIVSPKFDSIARLITDTIITKNQFPLEMQAGNYQWRVKAINNSSSTKFTDPWNLEIQ